MKKERAARLRALFDGKKKDFLRVCRDLPVVRVAWEDTEGDSGGVNEFYSECRFAPGTVAEGASRRSLVATRPVGVGDGYLLVEPVKG